MTTKVCKRCKEVKLLTEFHKHPTTKDGKQGRCKTCQNEAAKAWQKRNPERMRKHQIKYLYNVDQGWYEDTLVEQDFRCAGCLTHQRDLKVSLCVDHCHTTGKPRGLLCKKCNLALGHCNDNTETLSRLVNYLEKVK